MHWLHICKSCTCKATIWKSTDKVSVVWKHVRNVANKFANRTKILKVAFWPANQKLIQRKLTALTKGVQCTKLGHEQQTCKMNTSGAQFALKSDQQREIHLYLSSMNSWFYWIVYKLGDYSRTKNSPPTPFLHCILSSTGGKHALPAYYNRTVYLHCAFFF